MNRALSIPIRIKRKLGLSIVLVSLCLGLVLSGPAFSFPWISMPHLAQTANSVEELQQQQQQIEKERANIQKERDRLQNLEKAAQDRLNTLQNSIATTKNQIEVNESQLEVAAQKLRVLQAELAVAEQTYQERQFSTVARLRFLQRQQASRGWAVLMQSQNLNEFLDRRRQLKLLYLSDRQILTELKAQSDDLNEQRRNIERQKNEVALITQQLQAQKSEFEAQAKTQESLISRLTQDRSALEAAENQLERDSANLADLIRQRLAAAAGSGSVVVRGNGRFSYPISAAITSSFGTRIHPILGYRRFHAGVDFGAAHGSTIRSADNGRVIFAGWYGGYGRAVIVDHGGGITTLYAHTSEVLVSEGATVQRGQAIAAVGSTGLSTGPHLHFEVRENGEPVNPMSYF